MNYGLWTKLSIFFLPSKFTSNDCAWLIKYLVEWKVQNMVMEQMRKACKTIALPSQKTFVIEIIWDWDTTILNAFVNKYNHSQENTILCERTWKVLRKIRIIFPPNIFLFYRRNRIIERIIKQVRIKLRLQNDISRWLTK